MNVIPNILKALDVHNAKNFKNVACTKPLKNCQYQFLLCQFGFYSHSRTRDKQLISTFKFLTWYQIKFGQVRCGYRGTLGRVPKANAPL